MYIFKIYKTISTINFVLVKSNIDFILPSPTLNTSTSSICIISLLSEEILPNFCCCGS